MMCHVSHGGYLTGINWILFFSDVLTPYQRENTKQQERLDRINFLISSLSKKVLLVSDSVVLQYIIYELFPSHEWVSLGLSSNSTTIVDF